MNTDMISKYQEYIKTSFGEVQEVNMIDDAELSALPLLLRANYDFYSSALLGIDLILLFVKDSDNLTPMQMEKHAQMASDVLGKLPILVIERMPAYNVGRLIARRVNFVIPDKQAFIPQMLTNITKPKAEKKVVEQIPPLAQVMILRQLLKQDLSGMTSYKLVEALQSSYPTVNRAVNWLFEHELITMEGVSEKSINFSDKEALLNKALHVCTSPIKRVVYTDADIQGVAAGVKAMAQYTMINEDEQQCLAMTAEQLKSLCIKTDNRFGDVRVEVWRYNPALLTDTNIADPLSVYFSLKDNQDDRIQIELEHLITRKPW